MGNSDRRAFTRSWSCESTVCLRGTTDLNCGILRENMATGTDRRNRLNSLLFITKAFVQVLFFTMSSYYDYHGYFSSSSSYSRSISQTQFWSCPSPHSKSFIRYNSSLQEKSKFLNTTLKPQSARNSKAPWICYHHCMTPSQLYSEIPPACLFSFCPVVFIHSQCIVQALQPQTQRLPITFDFKILRHI